MKNAFEKLTEMLREGRTPFEIVPMENGKCMVIVSFALQTHVYSFNEYGNLLEVL